MSNQAPPASVPDSTHTIRGPALGRHLKLPEVLAREWNWLLEHDPDRHIPDTAHVTIREVYDWIHKYSKAPPSLSADSPLDADESGSVEPANCLDADCRSALCLSGGGIRSATFGLGVLQALAERNLLGRFHFLSTVSGGGYIGSFLSTWFQRSGRAEVFNALSRKTPAGGSLPPDDPEVDSPIRHLRRYSNYLSPRLGVSSMDTWTLISSYLRNLLLYWLFLVPILVALVALPRVFVMAHIWMSDRGTATAGWFVGAGTLLALCGLGCAGLAQSPWWQLGQQNPIARRRIHTLLKAFHIRSRCPRRCFVWLYKYRVFRELCRHRFLRWLYRTAWWRGLALNLGAVLMALSAFSGKWTIRVTWLLVLGGVLGVVPAAMAQCGREFRRWGRCIAFGSLGGIVTGLLLWAGVGLAQKLETRLASEQPGIAPAAISLGASADLPAGAAKSGNPQESHAGFYVWLGIALPAGKSGGRPDNRLYETVFAVFAVPWILLSIGAGCTLYVGLVTGFQTRSRQLATGDNELEWWARFGGWGIMTALAWLAWFALTLPLPAILAAPRTQAFYAWLLAAGGGLSGAVTLLLGRSRITSASPAGSGVQGATGSFARWITPIAGTIFAASVAVGLSLGISLIVAHIAELREDELGRPDLAHLATICASGGLAWVIGLGAVGIGLFGLVVSLCVDLNRFGLHGLYRNRLVRGYLGASNRERHPDPFTEFDGTDDFAMARLREFHIKPQDWRKKKARPYHVISAAINLVGGKELAWQQRKASAFTFTPLVCGSEKLGYRYSGRYGGRISVGTAVAISGAAFNSNMGYHTSPLVSLILTFFNIRLGWWLGNPRRPKWRRARPIFAARLIIEEALGLTDDEHPYIHLSDGGHFENLAIYEMVRRRCHFILVSDAGADPEFTFEDLGNAVRKIRIDMGIRVTFDPPVELCRWTSDNPRPRIMDHHAIGRIHYTDIDKGPNARDGVLLYIKPSLSGDEPPDVSDYARANSAFPHQPTLDQFYNESQFESYRALGYHIMSRIIDAGLLC